MSTNLPFSVVPGDSLIPLVEAFFDEDSSTFSYVVKDPSSSACALIDCVMEFDPASGATGFAGADRIVKYIQDNDLTLEWILETHVHADHLSAAPYIQNILGGALAIGKEVTVVQATFGEIFNEGDEFRRDGSQFDQLFSDGDTFNIGNMEVHVLHTPGHTPACISFIVGDAAFVGDTLFMPDSGTARADFPGGDATALFQSINRLYLLPDETRVFLCHDYGQGRALVYESSIAEQRESNIHVNNSVNEKQYVEMREKRDATLGVPRLILPSLQVNMRAGYLPPAEDNGRVYFKLPINLAW